MDETTFVQLYRPMDWTGLDDCPVVYVHSSASSMLVLANMDVSAKSGLVHCTMHDCTC